MKLIEVLDGGLLTTVQDRGRYGYQRYGVPVSGGMDPFALRAANRLAGNDEGAALLELTLLGPRLRFLAPATIAVAGADLGASLDGQPLSPWQRALARAGAELSFGGPKDGVRAYLAVRGGIDVPLVLGSRSTYLRSKLGGYEGRALRAGDVVEGTGEASPGPREAEASRHIFTPPVHGHFTPPVYGHEHVLRVLLGPQDDRFTAAGLRTFLSSTYTVTPQSDRMGYRLAGPTIEHTAGPDIVSDGSPLGGVQVAGDGVPIVLLADRGTAGGYTKIATVISADVGRLSQAAPGDAVRFEQVTLPEAWEAVREQEAWLEAMAGKRSARSESGPYLDRARRAAAAAAAVARVLDEM